MIYSNAGTTLACALKLFRNCISLEKDDAQVSFIKMRINGIWECPDADQEVGAKHIGDTERFQSASREPMPPLGTEAGELGELEDEPPCDSSRHGEEDEPDSSNPAEEDTTNVEEEAKDLAPL